MVVRSCKIMVSPTLMGAAFPFFQDHVQLLSQEQELRIMQGCVMVANEALQAEFTGSRCFACPAGDLVLHESIRICRSPRRSMVILIVLAHMDSLSAASLTPEGLGSHSGSGSQLHDCTAQHDQT